MSTPIDESAIRKLAYRYWEERGRPAGRADEHWWEAERHLKSEAVDESAKESFPASDPPASHALDRPPANAADKWATAATAPQQALPEAVHEDNPSLEGAHARAKKRAQLASRDVVRR